MIWAIGYEVWGKEIKVQGMGEYSWDVREVSGLICGLGNGVWNLEMYHLLLPIPALWTDHCQFPVAGQQQEEMARYRVHL